MNIFAKLVNFLKEVRFELKKVTWPTRQETIRFTLLVIGVSAGVAAFLGGLDYLFSIILTKFVL
ncbi:MAG: preprotein translocase subunit SecE [Parcubacteria group bacterium CG1_02_40_82]|uniref:Protein translocase subunit SecE n=3 Tax=Candidatus Portnoyibacteriota TaxID=1817913 RepID=A0A2M7YMY7_9BACT|nr:MAG: preprotein translocase subunit SecE [Parcubacteria group bacterium CG1_02_40_82]PIQ75615.1 MAG: preprotein translocase subunit SecE [Candidatus Portnoybacteria bacterium CG11_big_fil_rev_8_21_14_0_20_40_15]PIS31045.1 MAG: preprotein translocase subunit SecE [Candidatus Portnoybacteria bacterium CG08_land_8_20_14_0_20_40_83]PJA64341.1 MAG: preprotein translocase subunit SecE [Candidatus Portnoybacteria bacterium CG_4_9_14_3_um_filter_40_10]